MDNRLFKVPSISSSFVYSGNCYSILRFGKKFKSVNRNFASIKAFTIHMQREKEVLNANPLLKDCNEILIGNENIVDDVAEFLSDCSIRKNTTIAREILLTASNPFFKNISPEEAEDWKNLNVEWVRKTFGECCVYLVCHEDETTVHLHGLIVPKIWNEKFKKYTIQNYKFFDGKNRFAEYQTNYNDFMKQRFKVLQRGRFHSKARHIDIMTFYTLVNGKLDEKKLDSVLAKAKNSELLEIKLRYLQDTLNAYKNYNRKTQAERDKLKIDNRELFNTIEDLKKDKDLYFQAVKMLSELYKIPQISVNGVIRYVTQELNKSNNIVSKKLEHCHEDDREL